MPSRPGFFFCICPDPELIKRQIKEQLNACGSKWKQKFFWADEELPADFWESLTLSGLLPENRAVILRRAENLLAEDWKKFLPVLSSYHPRIWPFFCLEKEWSKNKPSIPAVLTKQKFWQLAQQKKWIWQSPGLTRSHLPAYLQKWAQSRGLSFQQNALQTAASLLPLDCTALEKELGKLELLVQEEIGEKDLEIISFQPEIDIFAFLQSLQHPKDSLKAWRKVLSNQIGSSNELIFPFLGLVLREARILWQLLSGEDKQVRLPPQIKSSKKNLAQRLGKNKIAEIWTLILEAEAGIKSGERSPDQALEAFINGLMHLFHNSSN